jgi:prepilin-type N-terminal cleavage/methylation domain-containing protein
MISSAKSNSGFTLLEVILAITILSTMTLLSTQAITRALKARTKIQAEVDDVSALRDSLRLIRTDVNLAFHHRDIEKEIMDLANKPKAPTPPAPGATPTPQPQPQPQTSAPQRENKREDPATYFYGTDSEMNFVTLNSGRMSSAVTQADFVEVGYSVKDCTNLTSGKVSKCLYRRIQNVIDSDVRTGGNEIVMLENVNEFKLRYVADTKQDWVGTWNSAPNTNDAGTRGRYPELVEVSLGISREFEGKEKTYSMQLVIPVHFPNNPTTRAGGQTNTSSQQGSGTSEPGGAFDQ